MTQSFSSLLFVPGNRPDRIAKAFASGADIVCIDLEDAVAPSDKAATRAGVLAMLPDLPQARTMVRINGVRTREGLEDILALADAAALPGQIMIPKLSAPAEAAIVGDLIGGRLAGIVGIIETATGLTDCAAIAAAPSVSGLMVGVADLSAELGCELAWEPLLAARSAIVLACAAAGITAIDGPSLTLEDGSDLQDEVKRARALGFVAKAAIHPVQLGAIDRAFRPDAAAVRAAVEALDAFAAGGGQAIRFRGRLLEAPLVRQLQRIAAFEGSIHA